MSTTVEGHARATGTAAPPPARRGRALEAALSAASTGSVILWRPEFPALVSASLVLVAATLAIDLARREFRAPSNVVPVAFVIALLFAVAVARAPTFPTDVRSYAADGRILVHYHQNPYLATPGAFPNDPLLSRIPDATAPYGPLFIAPAAIVARVAGTDAVGTRLAYQAAAAIAIAVALALLWRTRRSTAAIVLLGLHPAVAGTIVNGGHNDAFIGLALLAAVLACERKRFVAAGAILSSAMLIKITAGLALPPIAVWAAAKGGRRALLGVLGTSAVIVGPVLWLVPGLFRSIRSANLGLVTRTSVWNMYPLRAPLLSRFGDGAVTQLGLTCIGVAVVAVAGSKLELSDRVAGCVAAWLVLSAYVMPWYTVWALPVAAPHPRHPFTRVIVWQGAMVATAFLLPQRMLANHAISFSFGWIAPALLLGYFAVALRANAGQRSDGGRPALATQRCSGM